MANRKRGGLPSCIKQKVNFSGSKGKRNFCIHVNRRAYLNLRLFSVVTNLKWKDRKKVSSFKVHGMRTRLSKNAEELKNDQTCTNIDIVDVEGDKEKVQNAINTLVVDVNGKTMSWCLEEEVAKVIEIGVALGFDFGGNKKDITEEIYGRKLEDITRMPDLDIYQFLPVWLWAVCCLNDYSILECGSYLTNGISVDVAGSSGGLLSLWNNDVFKVIDCISNACCSILIGEWKALKKTVTLCNVYAPSSKAERAELCHWLEDKNMMKKAMVDWKRCTSKGSEVSTSDPNLIKYNIFDFFQNHYRNVKWRRAVLKDVCWKNLLTVGKEISHWETIREDPKRFIKEFHKDGSTVKDLNHIFLALSQKVLNPVLMGDFRLISLIVDMYKILAKVLSNRIKKVMKSIIEESQMTFVKRHQITDSFVIAREIINKWRKDQVGGLLVKLYFENAYDSVDHGFLDYMLRYMGFRDKWRGWICNCILSPLLSVLVNGNPTSQFGVERGLRQGDPLFPFLFNIVVEGLSSLILKAVNLGMVQREDFGGFPLGSRPCSKIFWKSILDKVEKILAPWKCKFLSKSDILTLIKVVIASIPIYFMFVFKMPSGITQKIKKLQRSFFWGDRLGKRKIHVVNGEMVRRSKARGGLGIGSIEIKNMGLLAKWIWHFCNGETPL
ncbi:hypothetical protein Ddye_005807 [Dipteronia dyeriana]|uniref:Reverse transcriptase domain-containing protein n=1 Tax=Dipteronia dyeriana TaxID=168575 RepID=A0AAE0CQ27_9ROSI|nr:hypothetical protein Ddye_005807 [Dipteronia dyeriana]